MISNEEDLLAWDCTRSHTQKTLTTVWGFEGCLKEWSSNIQCSFTVCTYLSTCSPFYLTFYCGEKQMMKTRKQESKNELEDWL